MKILHFTMWIACILCIPQMSFSQNQTSENDPGTMFAVPAAFDNYEWVNPWGASGSDDDYAYFVVSGAYDGYSMPLQATNFGFNIPAGSIITGVQVNIEKFAGASTTDGGHQLLIGNVGSGDDRRQPTDWPLEEETWVYGGEDDTWGCTLTPAIVNNPGFGVSVCANVVGTGDVNIDAITMIVYYQPAPPPIGIAIGADGSTPAASAILELKSTSQGLLLPRMTTVQRDAISSPATGLLVFDITAGKPFYYSGSAWQTFSPTASAPSGNGNGISAEQYDQFLKIINEQKKQIEELTTKIGKLEKANSSTE